MSLRRLGKLRDSGRVGVEQIERVPNDVFNIKVKTGIHSSVDTVCTLHLNARAIQDLLLNDFVGALNHTPISHI